METVYTFPSGYESQASTFYRWLIYANLTPAWGPIASDGSSTIQLPAYEVQHFRLLQRENPARYGNPPVA